jgi:hypothetical protein
MFQLYIEDVNMAIETQRMITFTQDGELRDMGRDSLVLCPLTLAANGRRNHCTNHCAWFSTPETDHGARCGQKLIGKVIEESSAAE